MLWMLGVVAILIDVISRFSGPGSPSEKVSVTSVITTTIRPLTSIPPAPLPEDVTYLIINEKKPFKSRIGGLGLDLFSKSEGIDNEILSKTIKLEEGFDESPSSFPAIPLTAPDNNNVQEFPGEQLPEDPQLIVEEMTTERLKMMQEDTVDTGDEKQNLNKRNTMTASEMKNALFPNSNIEAEKIEIPLI